MKGITMDLRRVNSVYYEITNITPLQLKVMCLLANGYTAEMVRDELGCPSHYADYVSSRLFKYYVKNKFKE